MCLNPKNVKGKIVACRKCIECLINKSTQWAYRIALESSLYEKNCMITLTYNEDNRPKDDHLSKRDLQLFIKSLRDHVGYNKIRYFACGEYGSKKGRPHYHVIIFNWFPSDAFYFCTDNKKTKLYRSLELEKIWQKGFSTVGEVTFDSAKYCAKYLQKVPEDGRPKPFTLMSKKPGIGFGAIDKKMLSDKIYLNGKSTRLPDYFINVLKKEYPEDIELLKLRRSQNDITNSFRDSNDYKFSEETGEIFYNFIDYDKYYEYVKSRRDKYYGLFQKDFSGNLKNIELKY